MKSRIIRIIKRVLNEDGIYFLPPFVEETSSFDLVKERMESGPFPLGHENDVLSIQAAKMLVLNTYYKNKTKE